MELGDLAEHGVELVLLGAECPDERALAGSLGAAEGAQRFGRAVAGTLLDAGPGRCRVTTVHAESDANAMLSALKQATARGGRLLLVYLAGQLVWDARRRRPALAVAGSLRENAAGRGLPCEWVTSAMRNGAQSESLLVLDLAAEPVAFEEWPEWADAGGLDVPAWGRVVRHETGRRGRAGPEANAGVFAAQLARLLAAGVPGAPTVLDPVDLDARLDLPSGSVPEQSRGRRDRSEPAAAHRHPAPVGARLLLRNRSVLRGALRSGLT